MTTKHIIVTNEDGTYSVINAEYGIEFACEDTFEDAEIIKRLADSLATE